MSSQPTDSAAVAAGGPDASQFTKPYRQIAAFVLLAVNGLFLLLAVLGLMLAFGGAGAFSDRANGHFGDFVGLVSIGLPLLAVLIATHIRPVVPHARNLTIAALIEYAVSALFGLIALFAGFVGSLSRRQTFAEDDGVREALTQFLGRLGVYALLGLAAFLVLRVYFGLFGGSPSVPGGFGPGQYRPYGNPGQPGGFGPAQPGQPGPGQSSAGQPGGVPASGPPQWGVPTGYGGQPTYGAYGNQPGYAGPAGAGGQPGYAGQPGYPGQPAYGGQPGYTAYGGQPGYGGAHQPAAAAFPTSAPPTSPFPTSAPPTTAPYPTSAPPAGTPPTSAYPAPGYGTTPTAAVNPATPGAPATPATPYTPVTESGSAASGSGASGSAASPSADQPAPATADEPTASYYGEDVTIRHPAGGRPSAPDADPTAPDPDQTEVLRRTEAGRPDGDEPTKSWR